MDKTLIEIIPGAKAIWESSRVALLIVATFTLGACFVLSHATSYLWLKHIALASMLTNVIYIMLIMYATSLSAGKNYIWITYALAYTLLLLSSTPALIMLLCGLDYPLFEILSWYILLDINKLMLPIATTIFLSVTYWLPVKEIAKIQKTYKHYINIKNNNGK